MSCRRCQTRVADWPWKWAHKCHANHVAVITARDIPPLERGASNRPGREARTVFSPGRKTTPLCRLSSPGVFHSHLPPCPWRASLAKHERARATEKGKGRVARRATTTIKTITRTMKRTMVEKARTADNGKIIIFAEQSPGGGGELPARAAHSRSLINTCPN